MDFRIEVNRLSQDELRYELRTRGVVDVEDIDARRKTLRQLMKLEKCSSFKLPPYPFTPEEDIAAVTLTILEIQGLVRDFSDTAQSPAYRKISTKLAYVFHRTERIPMGTEEQQKTRSKFLVSITTLWAETKVKAKRFVRSSTARSAGVLDFGTPAAGDEEDNTSTESESEAEHTQSASRRATKPHLKTILPSQWNLKFSGEPRELSLNAFLERVAELCMARNVDKAQLFASCVDLFTGRALIWYRANRSRIWDWDALVAQLRQVFLPDDYDERLFEEIKRRTQGPGESVDIYVAYMTNLFSRLNAPVSETLKLKILRRNMEPYFQHQMGLLEINSVDQLVSLGRRLEHCRSSIEAFKPPAQDRPTLEPDLAYATPSAVTTPARRMEPRAHTIRCWNCGEEGHRSQGCRNPRRAPCQRCGKAAGSTRYCSDCRQGNGRGRPL